MWAVARTPNTHTLFVQTTNWDHESTCCQPERWHNITHTLSLSLSLYFSLFLCTTVRVDSLCCCGFCCVCGRASGCVGVCFFRCSVCSWAEPVFFQCVPTLCLVFTRIRLRCEHKELSTFNVKDVSLVIDKLATLFLFVFFLFLFSSILKRERLGFVSTFPSVSDTYYEVTRNNRRIE